MDMPKPTIVITSTPSWAGEVRERLGDDYTLVQYAERTGYVTRLAEDHAALILVDGDADGWRFWTTTPKASPATRRIPVLLVSDDKTVRADASVAGADLVLPLADTLAQLRQIVRDYARALTPEQIAELDCQCQEMLPPMAVEGVAKFNAGEYYRQHDLFEAQWVKTPGAVRDLYRAVLQVGVAYYQIERGNYLGALKMLLRSVQWLAILPDVCQGIDVKQLREDSYRVRAELERMNPADITQFDRSLLKPVKLAQADQGFTSQ
jgi:predicted metal-dependent hydrolase